VLQQGPSSLPESEVALREWTHRFDAVIRTSGARTAVYMLWPESNRRDAFDALSRSYARAAEDISGMLMPVGEAWRRDPDVPLYGPDGFHPTPTATYLAALVMWQQITGQSPVRLPAWTEMSPTGRSCCSRPHRTRTRSSAGANHIPLLPTGIGNSSQSP
jgi:hypothetical protein